MKKWRVIHGDSLDVLKTFGPNIFDSMVTDPPAGIGLMSHEWDMKGDRHQWIAWMTAIAQECRRVLKPGAHAFVWSLPRTAHWTATALEDAGFEVRDVVTHVFGTGFPKSQNISMMIDKAAGAERQVIGVRYDGAGNKPIPGIIGAAKESDRRTVSPIRQHANKESFSEVPVTIPATELAKQWEGWGSALKPASEMYILIRKPLECGTIAGNVTKWGTGGLNIDASRIGPARASKFKAASNSNQNKTMNTFAEWNGEYHTETRGRFPTNFVLSHSADCEVVNNDVNGTETTEYWKCSEHCAVAEINAQSGACPTGGDSSGRGFQDKYVSGSVANKSKLPMFTKSKGFGASRFFYCAKASKSERGEGNNHPNVKNSELMAYFVNMVTPPDGVVLDPFAGSGSIGLAAVKNGFRYIGIDSEADYVEIAKNRLSQLDSTSEVSSCG